MKLCGAVSRLVLGTRIQRIPELAGIKYGLMVIDSPPDGIVKLIQMVLPFLVTRLDVITDFPAHFLRFLGVERCRRNGLLDLLPPTDLDRPDLVELLLLVRGSQHRPLVLDTAILGDEYQLTRILETELNGGQVRRMPASIPRTSAAGG